MELKYTREENARILIALLKAYDISCVVASPGATNISFVGSIQNDPYFKLYSAVDERHGAYLACGIALQTGKPVVLSCTGATASRNYLPALTEAYYRKLPILAVTSSQIDSHKGHLYPQMTDRSSPPPDCVRYSVDVPPVHAQNTEYVCGRAISTAILELFRAGNGPVHINLQTTFSREFDIDDLPKVRPLMRYCAWDRCLPDVSAGTKIVVWIGSHKYFSDMERNALEGFAIKYGAAVFCDHTSCYHGKNRILSALPCMQGTWAAMYGQKELVPDLVIHIGEISGDYATAGFLRNVGRVWRVSEDGEVRDYLNGIEKVFEMPEEVFFTRMAEKPYEHYCDFAEKWKCVLGKSGFESQGLPFSNAWVASQLAPLIPGGSILHFAILNSLRVWNCFEVNDGVFTSSNVGGFGIDGCISTLIGAALAEPTRLCFLVTGDLAFFYDLNSLGSRHVPKNVRILLVNNGAGAEFNIKGNVGAIFNERTNDFIAAGGHYGNKATGLVHHFSEDLGFKYISAHNKDEFLSNIREFIDVRINQSMILECWVSMVDDVMADAVMHKSIFKESSLKAHISEVLPVSVKKIISRMRV